MSSNLKIQTHKTDRELYAALVRVFGETTGGDHRWVVFTHEGVEMTFFAPPKEDA